MNVQGILVSTFFTGFCLRLRGAVPPPLLSPASAPGTGLFTMSFFSLSMRSGSATPFIAFCRLFSTFSGLALPRPPFRKLSYSDTLLKHLMFGKGGSTLGEYRAKRGSNLSEHKSNFSASLSASGSGSAAAGERGRGADFLSLLADFALFLSRSSMFETAADGSTRGRKASWETYNPLWRSHSVPISRDAKHHTGY